MGLKGRRGWNPQAIGDKAARFWALGLFSSIAFDLLNLVRFYQNPETSKETREKLWLELIRDSLDVTVPLFRLGFFIPNEGVTGLCGAFSALIGIYQTYP